MQVNLYTFAKRENSTKQPSSSTAAAFTCVLKDASGVLAPTIKLDPTIGNPRSYNYAYIADFGRYYYVRDWTYYRGEWEASLEVDVLASWKTQIGSTTLYILRSSKSSLWNKKIADNKYPALNEMKHLTNTASGNPFNTASYVIGSVGDPSGHDSTMVGGINYYQLASPRALQFFQYLNGHGVASYLNDLNNAFNNFADDLFLATYNPIQYISSVKYFPCQDYSARSTDAIAIGKVTVAISDLHCCPLFSEFGPYTVTIPKHPSIATRGGYLSAAPYSIYVFEMQPYGRIELDGSLLMDADTLSFTVRVDMISGDSLLFITATGTGYSATVGTYSAKVGADVQIGQSTSNIVQTAANDAMKAAAAAATDNYFGVAEAAISGATDVRFQGTVRGSVGSFLSGLDTPVLHLYYRDAVDMYATTFGYPVCKSSKISSAASFMICATGDVAFAGTSEEHKAVAGFLTSGFFYE